MWGQGIQAVERPPRLLSPRADDRSGQWAQVLKSHTQPPALSTEPWRVLSCDRLLHCAHPSTEPQDTIGHPGHLHRALTPSPVNAQDWLMCQAGCRSTLQVLGKQNNENRKFDFILGYIVISRSAWDKMEGEKRERGRKNEGKEGGMGRKKRRREKRTEAR